MIIGPGITIGNGIYVDAYAPASGIVADSLIFNLDMRNYTLSREAYWPDSSGNGNDFGFFELPNDGTHGTIYNIGTDTAYWYASGINGATATSDIFPANINYSKGAVVWTPDGGFSNIIGSNNQETFWGAGSPYIQAGNNGGNYYEVSSDPNTFPVAQWFYVSMSFSTTTGWKVYFNGNEVGSSVLTGTRDSASTPQIFSYAGNGNNSSGKIAAAHLYSRVLTPAEHLQNSNYYATRYSGSNPT